MGNIITDSQLSGNGVLNGVALGPNIKSAISGAGLGNILLCETAYVFHIHANSVSAGASTVTGAQGHGAAGARVQDAVLFNHTLGAGGALGDTQEDPLSPNPKAPIHVCQPWLVAGVIFGNIIFAYDNSGGNDVRVQLRRVDGQD